MSVTPPPAAAAFEQAPPADDEVEEVVSFILGRPYDRRSSAPAVANAARLWEFRRTLVDQGSYSLDEIAEGRRASKQSVSKMVERAQQNHELFTVKLGKGLVVPAQLLDEAFEIIPAWQPVLETLAPLHRTPWSLWTWIATPASLLDGAVPAELIQTDPEAVLIAAQRYVEQRAS